MVTISFVNDSTADIQKKESFRKAIQQEFRRVDYGEVDIIFDIMSPTSTLGKIDVLIFFCDNLITQGHQQDVGALSRLASLYNIPFATNRTTADMILTSSLFDNPEYQRIIPKSIENYAKRDIR